MRLTIVYDDKKITNEDLIPDHGFSCYIETGTETVVFDTGTDGKILLHNMEVLQKYPKKISKIVISHEHYDHNGGLNDLLKILDVATVYRIGKGQSTNTIQHIQITDPIQISKNIWSTGRLKGTPLDEQSLILKTSKGITVLTGCSHSGVENILRVARSFGPIVGLIGGFHGFNTLSTLNDINAIYPFHCTTHKTQIREEYPKTSFDCYVGMSIRL
ncbi:MAG: MBL fold metallo-hydrolase [Candidatus Thermoplasmatota archaeon]|nr:MBL fold metallo-hydrolase [Candidatus Thermoplasmatota archaeon]